MQNELSLWANSYGSAGDYGVFRTAAELREASVDDEVLSVTNGEDILAVLDAFQGHEVFDHIVIACHGGSTWLLDDEYGVTTGPVRRRGQVSVSELADAIAEVAAKDLIVSLAACMCSRAPLSWLRKKLGSNIGSDWGARAYQPGGEASFSARLRDELQYRDVWARVRGHRASGHATALALLAQHSGLAGTQCETLFGRSLGGIEPTAATRRWWTRTVTGLLAQRWLMGDDSVEAEIRALWLASH